MKKFENSFKHLLKDAKPIDWSKVEKEREERRKEAEKKRQIAAQIEYERFNAIQCPVCKSTDKANVKKTDSNGIIGPGYSSWVTEEYIVCNNCGVMYKDLRKNEKG